MNAYYARVCVCVELPSLS